MDWHYLLSWIQPLIPIQRQTPQTSPLPHPTLVPIVGMSSPSLESAVASTSVMPQPKAPMDPEDTDLEILCTDPEVSQHCQITPIPIESLSLETHPVVVIPELLILAEAYPEHLNRPGEGMDYLCHLCLFRHYNLDTVLMHIRKHLEVVVGCPVCVTGYENVASLCKHGKEVHHIQIVASASSVTI